MPSPQTQNKHRDSPTSSSSTNLTPTTDLDSDDQRSDQRRTSDRLETETGYELQTLGEASSQRAFTGAVHEDDASDDEVRDNGSEDTALRGRRQRMRRTSVHSFELYTPDEERRVKRRLDTHLVLFVALLYMLSFLDRSNIGNAKVAGLVEDLNLTDGRFEALLTVFYVFYVTFEWMTLCYKIFPPHIYISCCVCAWGVLASLQSLASSWSYLLVLRGLLGIGEAAFVGIPIYLSFFFRRDELAFRTGLFISAAPLATSFASSLAWAIMRFGKGSGIASWRLLFLLEGFPACLVAVWAWYWIPDSPSTARWLNARERKVAGLRMRDERHEETRSFGKPAMDSRRPRHKQKFQWREVRKTLMDPVCYLTAGMFFSCNVAFASLPVFLPTIIHHMNFSTLQSQALSAPPFLFSFVVVLVTAFVSDRIKSRSIPMVFHAVLASLGYGFLAVAGRLHAGFLPRYLAVFPICAGFFSAVTIVITWTVNNQSSDEGKGTGMAILNVIGQLGPLLGTRLYPEIEAPYYVKGMSVCAVFMGTAAILALTLRYVLVKRNRLIMRRALEPGKETDDVFLFIT